MSTVKVLGCFLGAGALAVSLLVLAGEAGDIPLGVLFRDAAVSGTDVDHAGKPYVGAGSMLAIVVWAVVAALSGFTAWMWRDGRLLVLAALTAVMCADDALQIHETVGPPRGVPEVVLPAAYAVTALVLLAWCRRRRSPGPGWALLTGTGLLGASLAVDLLDQAVLPVAGGWVFALEDGIKLLGAVAWAAVPVLAHAEHAAAARPAPLAVDVTAAALPGRR